MKSIAMLLAVLSSFTANAYQEALQLPFDVFSSKRYTLSEISELSGEFFDKVPGRRDGKIPPEQGQSAINNFAEVDTNHDGLIDKGEFVEEVVKRARLADFRGTGSLGREEFHTMSGHNFLQLFQFRE